MKDSQLLDEYVELYMSSIKYVEDLVSEPTQAYQLSFEQYLIMKEIADDNSVSLIDIAKKRGVTRGAISRQIRVLLKLDYITQEIDPDDRRRLILNLTPSGQKTVEELNPKIHNRFASWMETFGKKNAKQMLDLMNEFRHKIMVKDNQ
ncbi:MarR family transcriptional regulator [Latilactobacillus curvatus]|uniref:MarR family winged helix-turn-helix transcriptional regulator n=1 Tax=Latilactobacillus TaxID=2767885 RepID=UPI000B0E8172|nr:MarR family transcriptional regulator [Latilactobacillus curvatus]WBY49177.1 MarR family transcriptional regulator [Latilactobacillus curvatus]WIE01104.1 MarR family transcriptional regulator [Latilactobacillus curvatus]BBE25550.1 MarR family transcriptional regulator [Latilactobacillus curvatus]